MTSEREPVAWLTIEDWAVEVELCDPARTGSGPPPWSDLPNGTYALVPRETVEALEAEVARLRGALRKVNTAPHTKRCAVRHSVGAETICDCRFTLQDIARSALMVGVEDPDDE